MRLISGVSAQSGCSARLVTVSALTLILTLSAVIIPITGPYSTHPRSCYYIVIHYYTRIYCLINTVNAGEIDCYKDGSLGVLRFLNC